LGAAGPNPCSVAPLAIAGRSDPLRLAGDRGQHAGPVAVRHEEQCALDLLGASDTQPVGVLRGLGSTTDALAGDDPELREEAQDAVGELPADGPELQDDAGSAVHK